MMPMIHLLVASVHPFLQNIYIYIYIHIDESMWFWRGRWADVGIEELQFSFLVVDDIMFPLVRCALQTNRMKDTCRKKLVNICDNILHCDDAGLWREIEPHVCFLVCPKWPCEHRNSCAHGLERGIPAAVRQESPGGLVWQDLQLGRPAFDQHATASRPFFKSCTSSKPMLSAHPESPRLYHIPCWAFKKVHPARMRSLKLTRILSMFCLSLHMHFASVLA